ncbi:uncharacterized protein LOC129615585 [Condylostylus longicornis]|uniref:uncharacterized protein LOC129615585 n=1 Tax=Condylostylus longicornis TaxID=2530218 RepID=UPI00244E3271|nr:uncharacterized protein LOC129615585 [Condylostylus longicornis]XP_055386826.1 uncharacterized protein LOC129615585 [Condylostylus longicornis]
MSQKNIIYFLYSCTICVNFIDRSESGVFPENYTTSPSSSSSVSLSSSSSLSSSLPTSLPSVPSLSSISSASSTYTIFNNQQQQQQQQQSLIDLDSTLLKNLLNISNNPPELIEYYELDDDIPTSTFQSVYDVGKITASSQSITITTLIPSVNTITTKIEEVPTSIVSSSIPSSLSTSSVSSISLSSQIEKTSSLLENITQKTTIILTTQPPTPPPDIYPDPEEVNRKIKVLNINHIPHRSTSSSFENISPSGGENIIDEIPISSSSSSSLSSNSNNNNNNYNNNNIVDYSIRDNDFKGHDLIDNIMYIYYGSQKSIRNGIGSSIVIGGSVLALAAQILCLILMILRNRRLRRQNALFSIFFNFVFTLLIANLIFVLGVQATRSEFRCGVIAILLHYFHLSTTIWGLIYIYIIYDYIVNDCGINLKYNYFMAYGAPAIYVLFSCAISSSSYETVEFCWMSVHRGMIVNFMIPISGIILTSTVLGTLCLREIATKQREVIAESIENILENAAKCHEINNAATVIETDKCCEIEERATEPCKKNDFYDSKFDLGVLSIVDLSLQSSADTQDFTDFKRSIKFWLFFQPAFALCWFFGTIAMENRQTYIMPIIFIISCNIMNWYLLIRSPYICPIIQDQNQKEKFPVNDTNEESQQHVQGTDTIPLLCTPNSKLQNPKISNIIEDSMNEQINNLTVNWGDSLGDISINLDSISTISS